MESNYYQEYEYISFFATESESNHPLGEMVTSPDCFALKGLLLSLNGHQKVWLQKTPLFIQRIALNNFVFYEKFSMGTQARIFTQPVLSLTMTKENP